MPSAVIDDRVTAIPGSARALAGKAALHTRLATSEADLRAAQRLRYDVFVTEMGGDGGMVDHAARLEADRFDPFYDHLLLIDPARDPARLDHVVGVYRLMPCSRAQAAGGFYSATEYDLAPLLASGRRLLELGRSCIHPEYRGSVAMLHLWNAVADYVRTHDIDLMFGVASFPGTDVDALALPLSWLHRHHLAPEALRVRTLPHVHHPMDLIPVTPADRPRAMAAVPALIRAYLRLGGFVGDGAFVDHRFRTTDVFLVLDTAAMPDRRRAFHSRAMPGR
ncbi:MAG: GNAT family N-acetyltransferase [Rhodobacteraceae bacterium]|nr:GNAT family N-acetyltransferase [Paracoccaceae bacterium]